MSDITPLYDIQKTFLENFNSWDEKTFDIPKRVWPDSSKWHDLLGFRIASRIGVAACAVTAGKGIKLAANLGFDVLTYKTIRSRPHPAHPLPNIVFVDNSRLLNTAMLAQAIHMQAAPVIDPATIAISNSFGNACIELDLLAADLEYAKSAVSPGQVLIVSVYGEENSARDLIADFIYTAHFAREMGADIIEVNLSCPNIKGGQGMLYHDVSLVEVLSAKLVKAMPHTPILVKLGLFADDEQMAATLKTLANNGISGITAINSVSMQVINNQGQPAFGVERPVSGVSGYPIRSIALDFIKSAHAINKKESLNLTVLGVGGVTKPEHFDLFLNEGASVALSATGMMWNPYLAREYHHAKSSDH